MILVHKTARGKIKLLCAFQVSGVSNGWEGQAEMKNTVWRRDEQWPHIYGNGQGFSASRVLVMLFAFRDSVVFSGDLETRLLKKKKTAAAFTLNRFRSKPEAYKLSV